MMLFQPWQQKPARKVRTGNTRKRKKKTWKCAFFKAAAPPGTAAVAGKAAAAPRWASCARGKSVVCQCPAVLILLTATLSPHTWLSLCLEEEQSWWQSRCCAVLCWWHPSTHAEFLCRSLPLLREHLVGQGKKETSIFQGRKIRVNCFPSLHGITQPSECCTATVSYCSAMAARYVTFLK